MRAVAALFVDARGCYAGLEGVEVWDEKRDARLYTGPHPVVAHPPCSRWCQLAYLVEYRYGYKRGNAGRAIVTWCKNRTFRNQNAPRIGKGQAAATPPKFRDALLAIARSVPVTAASEVS